MAGHAAAAVAAAPAGQHVRGLTCTFFSCPPWPVYHSEEPLSLSSLYPPDSTMARAPCGSATLRARDWIAQNFSLKLGFGN